ncbi:MAG: hypothetical protein ACREU6_06820 [Steroidobacteraceae bacterium]
MSTQKLVSARYLVLSTIAHLQDAEKGKLKLALGCAELLIQDALREFADRAAQS